MAVQQSSLSKAKKLPPECAQSAGGDPGRQRAVTGVTHSVTSILACGTDNGVAASKILLKNIGLPVIHEGDRYQAK